MGEWMGGFNGADETDMRRCAPLSSLGILRRPGLNRHEGGVPDQVLARAHVRTGLTTACIRWKL